MATRRRPQSLHLGWDLGSPVPVEAERIEAMAAVGRSACPSSRLRWHNDGRSNRNPHRERR